MTTLSLERQKGQPGSSRCSPWPLQDVRRVVLFACLLALGIVLNVAEGMILPRGWPVRLGLANLSILCGLFLLRSRDLFLLAFFRVMVTSLLFGFFFQLPMWLSLGGGLASVAAMAAAFRGYGKVFSIVGISLLGAAAHMSAQVGLFALLFAPSVLELYPVFLAVALLGGLVVGGLMIPIQRRLALGQ